jgi:hypothetical protein
MSRRIGRRGRGRMPVRRSRSANSRSARVGLQGFLVFWAFATGKAPKPTAFRPSPPRFSPRKVQAVLRGFNRLSVGSAVFFFLSAATLPLVVFLRSGDPRFQTALGLLHESRSVRQEKFCNSVIHTCCEQAPQSRAEPSWRKGSEGRTRFHSGSRVQKNCLRRPLLMRQRRQSRVTIELEYYT